QGQHHLPSHSRGGRRPPRPPRHPHPGRADCQRRRDQESGGGVVIFLTELKEGLLIAWDAIVANKLRAALTTLGIIIGIVSVTLMGAAIDGLNRSFHESVSTMGADVLFADRMGWFINSQDEWLKQFKRREVTLDQVKVVERQMTLA